MNKRQLIGQWMRRRAHYASDEELRGFIRRPMHPRMVEIATEEIERRQKLALTELEKENDDS